MFKVSSNAEQLAARNRRRRQAMSTAIREGLHTIVVAVDKAQVKNLSGDKGAAPGSYPVPNRTGNLFRGAFFKVDPRTRNFAVVGNTTKYAAAVHNGRPTNKGPQRPRPFLDDAAKSVPTTKLMAVAIARRMLAVQ